MKRLTPRAWSQLRPGLQVYPYFMISALVELFQAEHASTAAVACVLAAVPISVAALLLMPREPMPMFTADELQAALPWGVALLGVSLAMMELLSGPARYLWVGAGGLGVIYIVVGLVARRWVRSEAS